MISQMRKLKKISSILLALAMMLGTAACQQGGTTSSGSTSGSSSSGSESGLPDLAIKETNQYGYEVTEEPIKFSFYMASEGDQAEEDERLAHVAAIMKDEFNLEIQKVLYKQDPTERLNLMLTDNSYPECIVSAPESMVNTFIDQDRAVELTPYLEKYAPNVLAGLDNYINLMKDEEGNVYKLPYNWGDTTDAMGRDFSIRVDLLKKAGLDFPDSFESYYEAIKTIVEQNPTNENGEKTYGLTAFTLKGEEFYQAPLSMMGFAGTQTGYYKVDEENNTLTHWVDTEEGLWVAKYINQFWRDGLIDPDFQTKDYDQSVAFMSNSRVVGNIGTWWHNYVGSFQVWMNTDSDWQPDERMAELTWEVEGQSTPKLISNNYIRTQRTIITDKAEHPEWICHYWNWEVTPKGVAFVSMGPAGEEYCWTINDNDEIVLDDRYWYGDPEDSNFNWGTLEETSGSWNYQMMAPGYTPVDRREDPGEGWADPIAAVNLWDLIPDYAKLDQDKLGPTEQVNLLNKETSTTYLWDMTPYTVSYASTDPIAITYTDIQQAIVADWIKVVMAESEEQCEQYFNEMKDHLKSLGLDDVTAYQQEVYSSNMELLNG